MLPFLLGYVVMFGNGIIGFLLTLLVIFVLCALILFLMKQLEVDANGIKIVKTVLIVVVAIWLVFALINIISSNGHTVTSQIRIGDYYHG